MTITANELRQQLQNADEATAALQGQRDLVQAAMQAHENAVGALKQSASERKAYIADIRDSIATFARDLRGLQATAVITRDTPSERTTIATIGDLTERKTTCETSLQAYIAEDAAALAAEQQEETEHEQAYGVLTAQRDALEEQQQALIVQRDEIFTALGTAIYQEGVSTLERLEATMEKHTADAQQGKTLLDFSAARWKEDLKPWSDLARQAREIVPDTKTRAETAADRIRKAYIAWLDALEQDIQTLPTTINGRYLQRELSLDENSLGFFMKQGVDPLDRRNHFDHLRSRVTELLREANESRR